VNKREYDEAMCDALKITGARNVADRQAAVAVARLLTKEILEAVVNGKVLYDGSDIVNDPEMGKPMEFYPAWVQTCEEELLNKLLLGTQL